MASGGLTLTKRWEVQPFEDGGVLPFLGATDNAVRGIGFSRVSGNVLVASRTLGTEIYLLAGADADEVGLLDALDLSGGIFPLNMIAVADDGVVYACNLAINSAAGARQFKIYRWADEMATTLPTVVWEGDPAGEDEFGQSLNLQRWGDSFAVRGAGVGTQLLVPSGRSSLVAVFTTTDGLTFTPTLLDGAAHASGSLGGAFGAGDTIYTKYSSGPLVRSTFDLALAMVTESRQYTTLPAEGRPLGIDAAKNRLAVLVTGGLVPESVRLYDISDPGIEPIFQDEEVLTSDNANTNATGAVAFGDDVVFVLSTNNGVAAYDIEDDSLVEPAGIDREPLSQAVIEGGSARFNVGVTGTPPFTFQWFKGTDPIDGATEGSYRIDMVTADDAGDYSVTVTNAADTTTSLPATLTILPRVDTEFASVLWSLGPGERTYLTGDDNFQRGLALNPANGNVLVASRAGAPQVRVVDGATGDDLRQLDLSGVGGVPGETFPINMVGAADDGAVYAGNLTLTGDQFVLYRWADDAEATFADIVFDARFDGAPVAGQRIGDTMDVRGSGVSTQVLCATRSTNQVVVFTTDDGIVFTANVVTVPDVGGHFGLGVAFGEGDSFWGNSQGGSLYHCSFDLGTGTGQLLHEFTTAQFPSSIGPVAVDPGRQLLLGVSNENPDNVQVFDISDLENPPVLLDQEFFESDNANTNGTGAAAFGDGVVVALGTNNGLLALSLLTPDPEPGSPALLTDVGLAGDGAQFQFTLVGEEGASYLVQGTPTMAADEWEPLQPVTLTGTTTETFTFPLTIPARYFRAVELPE